MATPTGTLTADKPKYAPGDTVTLRYQASDPDSKTYSGTGLVADNAGNALNLAIDIVVEDPLTYAVPTVPGMTFTRDQVDPAKFTGTAPG